MSTLKKLLLTLMVLGAVGSSLTAGTYATFTATTGNATSTFSTGTIVLSLDNGTTTCRSTGSGTSTDTNDHTCSPLLDFWQQKNNQEQTVDVALTSDGSLDGALTVTSEACELSLCGSVQLLIQRFDDPSRTGTVTCVYPTTGCEVFDPAVTLQSFGIAGTVQVMSPLTTAYLRIKTKYSGSPGTEQGQVAEPDFIWNLVQL